MRCLFVGVLLLVSACGGKTGLDLHEHAGGTSIDAATRDASIRDATSPDSAVVDDGGRDSAFVDASTPDACALADCGVTLPSIVREATLHASNGEEGLDQFGHSVAIDGDTLVVGANFESSGAVGVDGNQADNGVPSSGAAYVFVRSGDGWTQQAYLKASNTDAADLFGSGVAISGDTIVVGAPAEDSRSTQIGGDQTDNSAEDAGAAYVFVRRNNTWTQEAYLKASNAEARDHFGASVAIDGQTIAVSAPTEDSGLVGEQTDNSALDSGAAYVFTRAGNAWTQASYLKVSNPSANDNSF